MRCTVEKQGQVLHQMRNRALHSAVPNAAHAVGDIELVSLDELRAMQSSTKPNCFQELRGYLD